MKNATLEQIKLLFFNYLCLNFWCFFVALGYFCFPYFKALFSVVLSSASTSSRGLLG